MPEQVVAEAPVPGKRRCCECDELKGLDDLQFEWDALRGLCKSCFLRWLQRGGEKPIPPPETEILE
jgi:hypothetical protein